MTRNMPFSERRRIAVTAIAVGCWLAITTFAWTAETTEQTAKPAAGPAASAETAEKPAESPTPPESTEKPAASATTSESARVFSGEIHDLGDHSFSLTSNGNRTQEIQVGAESRITLNGRPVTLKDLQTGDRVRVRLEPAPATVAARVRAFRQAAEGQEPEERERAAAPSVSAAALGALVIPTPEGDLGVWRVAPRSPAAQAGLQSGDQIEEIDGREISTPAELVRFLAEKRPGDQIHITFLHGDQERTATATLASREDMLSAIRQAWQERRAARREREAETEPWLGMLLGEPKDGGVTVSRVLPNSPAAEAGVESGDLLRSIDNQKVDSAQAAVDALQQRKPGEKIPLQITRNGKEQNVDITVASRERPREEARRLRAERQSRPGEGERSERIEGMLRDLKKDLEDLRHEVQDMARKSSESERR